MFAHSLSSFGSFETVRSRSEMGQGPWGSDCEDKRGALPDFLPLSDSDDASPHASDATPSHRDRPAEADPQPASPGPSSCTFSLAVAPRQRDRGRGRPRRAPSVLTLAMRPVNADCGGADNAIDPDGSESKHDNRSLGASMSNRELREIATFASRVPGYRAAKRTRRHRRCACGHAHSLSGSRAATHCQLRRPRRVGQGVCGSVGLRCVRDSDPGVPRGVDKGHAA